MFCLSETWRMKCAAGAVYSQWYRPWWHTVCVCVWGRSGVSFRPTHTLSQWPSTHSVHHPVFQTGWAHVQSILSPDHSSKTGLYPPSMSSRLQLTGTCAGMVWCESLIRSLDLTKPCVFKCTVMCHISYCIELWQLKHPPQEIWAQSTLFYRL